MADQLGDCFAAICGCLCICCSDVLSAWCLSKSFGSGSGNSTSCCKRKFDDDDFEREEAKLHEEAIRMEQERRQTSGSSEGETRNPTTAQPLGRGAMRADLGLSLSNNEENEQDSPPEQENPRTSIGTRTDIPLSLTPGHSKRPSEPKLVTPETHSPS